MKRAAVVAWTLIALSCTVRVESVDHRQAIMEADRAFDRAVAAGGADAWVAHFATDGMMFRGGTPVVGHDSVRAMMQPAFADTTFTLRWAPTDARVSQSGDLGYTIGRYESRRVAGDGRSAVGTGSYVTIWAKQADGSWKVVLDIGSEDAPPPRAAPE